MGTWLWGVPALLPVAMTLAVSGGHGVNHDASRVWAQVLEWAVTTITVGVTVPCEVRLGRQGAQ